jgi:hypothetical protein
VEGVQAALTPGGGELSEGRLAGLGQAGGDGLEEGELLHPAAGEGIQGQDLAHEGVGRQVAAPQGLVGGVLVAGAGFAELVEQDQHRFADPGQDLHLGGHVAGLAGLLGRIDQIEHHVGLLAHVADGLLAGPEGAVAPAVPHLGEQPAHRVALQAQALMRRALSPKPGVSHRLSTWPSALSIMRWHSARAVTWASSRISPTSRPMRLRARVVLPVLVWETRLSWIVVG